MHGPSPSSAQSTPHPGASRELWALYYASRGWRVFPLHTVDAGRCSCGPNCPSPGEHPLSQHGVKDASNDPEQIRAWWAERPEANVGIATSAASGLVVTVIDPLKGGEESYAKLQQELPSDTFAQLLKVRTGSGGTHLYFEYPGGHIPCRAKLRPGIDVEADGGYVVAPPSLDVSGVRCRFTSNSGLLLPPLPQALCDLIIAEPQAQTGDEASPLRAIIKAEHVANSLDETPQQKGEGSLSGQTKQAREKPDQEGSATNDVKSRLLVDNSNPDRTVRALQGILGATGEIFDRGVPVRIAAPWRG
jgi:Bifunctional DNA primase/polymerase, N-terminal